MKIMLLTLEESMPGWHPKTTKLRGSPNHALELRKTEPLVTILMNGAEHASRTIACNHAAQNPEAQARREFSAEKSYVLDESRIGCCALEVLSEAKGSKVPQHGW